MAESPVARPPDEALDSDLEYRSIEPWALASLALGLISPLAMLAPLLWLIPPLGILASVIALRRIRSDSTRIGRATALWGLALSVVFGVALPVQTVASQLLLSRQARPVADQWFELLREKKPERAVMLQFAPDQRQPLDERIWLYLRNNNQAKSELQKLVESPLARVLLELGDKAQARFYKTEGVHVDRDTGHVGYLYTVTYVDESGKKKTFFARIFLERKPTKNPEACPWRVVNASGGFDPNQ